MINTEESTPAIMASKFVNSTDRHIFLTGKAGTGKTTFLKNIVHHNHKKTVVAAPTGIAAINAGGVTLHSLFHLPFGAFVPENIAMSNLEVTTQINTPRSLIKSLRMNGHKRKLINTMELLIIDEVSMLRGDLLDAIDVTLRHIRRRKNLPFGGIQILFIGDLLQLPPVIKQEERKYLDRYYNSNYFFEAKALNNQQPVYIELEKIYRQTDQEFINLLNHFRDNNLTNKDLETLNQHYKPDYKHKLNDGYVFLTTHNHKAEEINKKALKKLNGDSFFFDAMIDGDFPEHLYPIESRQEFKEGAQVMFIKNDYSGENRYFNGKIGTISALSEEDIEVSFDDGSPSTVVERYTWENKRFSLNKKSNEIEEKVKGTFSHFPLKLAWAITIHKSQGLTFSKAVIDVSRAFAPGQVYVALSRLISLDGLILTEPLPNNMLDPDESLKAFQKNKMNSNELDEEYNKHLPIFIRNYVLESFQFSPSLAELTDHVKSYNKDETKSFKQQFKPWAIDLRDNFRELKNVADKFQSQIKKISDNQDDNWLTELKERVKAAKEYFEPRLNKCSQDVLDHIDELEGSAGVKKYINELRDLESLFFKHIQSVNKAEALINAALENKEISKNTLELNSLNKQREQELEKKASKASSKKKITKTSSRQISFEIFQAGKTIEEIAEERSLAVSTIEGHLSYFVGTGDLDVHEFVDKTKASQIKEVARTIESTKLSDIKARLGDEFTYSEIRFTMASYNGGYQEKHKKAD